jgi:gamma-glutamylcyclotransferase (GGCT)/AIG2-like uncharacterized protein YtfP
VSYLFVYGTLLPQRAPAEVSEITEKLRPVGRGYVRGHLYDFGDYPGAVLDISAASTIQGEVFEIPDEPGILERLDAYEGFDPDNPKDSLFLRSMVPVSLANGSQLSCWIYVYNRTPAAFALVPGGDYSKAGSGSSTRRS